MNNIKTIDPDMVSAQVFFKKDFYQSASNYLDFVGNLPKELELAIEWNKTDYANDPITAKTNFFKNLDVKSLNADFSTSWLKKYNETYITERRALGELDHPDSSVVNLNNVSHNILEMAWRGKDLVGTVEVLHTPSGNILKALFQSGIKLGISSRGLGSVKEVMREAGSAMEVQPDFELIAFDFVSNPSTHGAFLSPVNESLDKTINTKYDNINRLISEIIREF